MTNKITQVNVVIYSLCKLFGVSSYLTNFIHMLTNYKVLDILSHSN